MTDCIRWKVQERSYHGLMFKDLSLHQLTTPYLKYSKHTNHRATD